MSFFFVLGSTTCFRAVKFTVESVYYVVALMVTCEVIYLFYMNGTQTFPE